MAEHTNTHAITPDCMRRDDFVLGNVDGRHMIGVTFAPEGWKPARLAYAADLEYFGAKVSPPALNQDSGGSNG